MRLRILGLLGMILIAAVATVAHGNKKHVIGTIEKLNPDSVLVKTVDGKLVEVKLVPTTAYVSRVEKTDKPAKISDLAVGERVVVHAIPKGETLEADEIKFTAGAAHAAAAKKPQS